MKLHFIGFLTLLYALVSFTRAMYEVGDNNVELFKHYMYVTVLATIAAITLFII